MLALLLPASASADEATQIIVKRDPGLSAAEQRDIRADAGVRLLHTLSIPRTEVVTAPADDASAALRELNRNPDVVYAEKDRIRTSLTNDPAFPKMWGLQNTGQNVFGGGLYDADIDAPEAWTQLMPTLAQGVEVGVVDSGVDAAHEDLDGLVTAYDFVDAANGDPGGEDENGHGTHVAGTIGAIGDNNKGVVGVGRGASIVSLRVLKANGQGYDSDIAEAFDYAGTNGIPIVNASLGGTGFSQTLEDAIARNSNVLFVVAAGNGGGDSIGDDNDQAPIGQHGTWPCDAPQVNVVCVGASTKQDERAGFSNYGTTSVDLFAPGEAIVSTIPLGVMDGLEEFKYAYLDGTSMASPHVAGAAALVLAAVPGLAPQYIRQILLETVDVRAGLSESVSGGRLNAGEAVNVSLNGPTPPDGDGDGVPDAIDACDATPGGVTAAGCPDPDNDAFPSSRDNCPTDANADQLDTDADGLGDVCDPDMDNDGAANASDNCLRVANADQADADHDTLGDACDPDWDNDGDLNGADNCPTNANANQSDVDHDGAGDVCDATPRGPDADGDGKPLLDDKCPTVKAFTSNGCPVVVPPPVDSDRDGIYNGSDPCPYEYAKTANGCPLPSVTSLSARAKKRRATISVRTTRAAAVEVTIQRKVCAHKRCRWVRVARKTATTVAGRATVTATKLKRGSYRAIVVLSSSAGRTKAETQRFRVR